MLRYPACIAGVAGIWGIWRFTRAIFADRTVALLSAGLLTVSPFHIAYSQEARGYTTSFLFGFLGIAAMFEELNRGGVAAGMEEFVGSDYLAGFIVLDDVFRA